MPLSSVLNYLQILNNENENILMPTHSLGTPEFKMMYGTRGLLNDHVWKSSSAPGVSQVLEQYRSSSNAGVDESKYEKLVAGVVGVVQSLVDLRYFSTSTTLNTVVTVLGNPINDGNATAPADVLDGIPDGNEIVAKAPGIIRNSVFKPDRLFAGTDAIDLATGNGAGNPATLPVSDNNRVVYQLQRPATQTAVDQGRTLSLTESSGQAAQLQHITSAVGSRFGAATNQDARKIERMYNIVDMNIIPVNVHALMRGMPLAPLYNYTYTFEENARLALGINAAAALAAHEPTNAREWFFKILENPYYDTIAIRNNNTTISSVDQLVNDASNLFVTIDLDRTHDLDIAITDAYIDTARAVSNVLNAVKNPQFTVQADAEVTNINNRIALAVAALAAGVGTQATIRPMMKGVIRGALNAGFFSSDRAGNAYSSVACNTANTAYGVAAIGLDAFVDVTIVNAHGGNAGVTGANVSQQVLDIGVALAVGLIATREFERGRNRLTEPMITNINTTLAQLIVTAAGGAPDDAARGLVDGLRWGAAIGVNAQIAVLDGAVRVLLAGAGVGSPLGVLLTSGGAAAPNTDIKNALFPMVQVSMLTAALNRSDRLDRYSLDRHSANDRTLASLMHGDETLLMGRPKFISDQLFHKVLPTLDSSGHINYYDEGTYHQVPAAAAPAFNAAQRDEFRNVFQARFNTRIVRNLMHCTNVQRVLRLRLNQELTSYRDVLVNSESITNPSVTEFGNLRWSDMRLDGTVDRTMDPRNEDARSRTYNSEETVGIPR